MASSNSSSDELIGQTIASRYRIISRLGAGGMGVAYRAWDEDEGRPVVIKIPKSSFLEDPKFAERFNREIRLLQGLSHPNIVPIVDVGEHEGSPYVVMRFLPGGSLSNRRLRDDQRRPKPNPIGMLHLWLPAVADALDHVHANGAVHRDVKPANIFFDAFWGAFLGDFGIAKIVEESDSFDKEHTLTATNMGIGTTEYMAPEQFTPKAVIDGRVDQYSLAVIVYEMLSGVRPFTGETAHIAVEVLTHSVPPLSQFRSDLPATLVDAVHRGLAKKPTERFATCREFANAVLRQVPVLEDEPNVARLLCPRCGNILKLPTAAAGQRGKCPRCQTRMEVADDLGALWELDEARRQRREGNSVAEDSDQSTAVGRVGGEVDDNPLKEFKPVSGPTPTGGQVMSKAKSALWAMTPWVVAAGLLAAAAWWVWPQPPPTYEQRVAKAEETLKRNPEDRIANDLLGRHWCFREVDWNRGLPHLAKGGAVGLSAAAQQELELRESTAERNPGDFIRLASRWWALGNDDNPRPEKEALAIKQHARDTFLEWVDQLVSPPDIYFTRRWLDSDAIFRNLVENERSLDGPELTLHPVFLSDMPVKKSFVGWDKLLMGQLPRNKVNGIVPQKGIYAHAPSLVIFDLPDGFEGTLRGKVAIAGMSKEHKHPSSCRFRILNGEDVLWESGVVAQDKPTGLSTIEEFDVTLKHVKTLTLEVDSLGSNHSDWSIWVDPVLVWLGSTFKD